METREKLSSRLGFILLSAGCAIGIGNVWKFPYIAGQNGGGLFVLIYIFFLVTMGIPMLTIEFSVGRASRKSPLKSMTMLEKKGQKWHLHGYFAMAGNYLLMMFYTAVCGWMLHYCYLTATGKLTYANINTLDETFSNMTGNAPLMLFWVSFVIILGFLICSFGVQSGVEKISKFMMIALLALIVILVINSLLLPGGTEGLRFYLVPNISNKKISDIFQIIVAAMNQSFFTLSIGIGSMAIFGSYIDKKHSLLGESVRVASLDTFVAIASGLIIFPACFAYGTQPDSGPDLIFKTLPKVFANMPLGRLWGSLFFIFMAFAAFSTVIAVFENIISCGIDLTNSSRKKVAIINIPIMIILSLPCILGFNLLSFIKPFGENSNLMDIEDFIVSNILLPLGSLVYLLFTTSKYGWGWKNFKTEANEGSGYKIKNWMRVYISYVIPILIIIIFIYGIYDKFK